MALLFAAVDGDFSVFLSEQPARGNSGFVKNTLLLLWSRVRGPHFSAKYRGNTFYLVCWTEPGGEKHRSRHRLAASRPWDCNSFERGGLSFGESAAAPTEISTARGEKNDGHLLGTKVGMAVCRTAGLVVEL